MCGLVGIINFKDSKEINVKKVSKSLDLTNYRGPDNTNIWSDDYAVLGHNRLSIIGLSSESNQPFHLEDDLVIVFNGEIYNYLELSRELNSCGIQFKTKSDTEVLIWAFKIWGERMLEKLCGMFVFVIYNKKDKSAFIGRDRFGEKPLFWFLESGRFCFASNLQALKELLPNKQLNYSAISELFAFQYITSKTSIYENVNKFPAGNFGHLRNGELIVKSYYTFNYRSKVKVSFDEAILEVERLLENSIKLQLRSDVPVSVFLSGGVDSGLIAAIASKINPQINALTMSVPGSIEYDETENAQLIARRNKIGHQIIPIDVDCVRNLPKLLSMIEPFGDSSIIALNEIARAASSLGIKVVLSGDGGDEIFGGYAKPAMFRKYEFKDRPLLRYGIELLGQRRLHPSFNFLRGIAHSSLPYKYGGIDLFYKFQNLQSRPIRNLIFHESFLKLDSFNQNTFFLPFREGSKKNVDNEHDEILFWGIKNRLIDDYLVKVDTATMANSIEARAPFLDPNIIDFTSKLEPQILMPNLIDKEILKRMAIKYIPAEVINKPKKGFSIPVKKYFRGHWGVILKEFLNEGVSEELRIINSRGVLKLLDLHQKENILQLDRLLFSIFAFEIWLRVSHLNLRNEDELGLKLKLNI